MLSNSAFHQNPYIWLGCQLTLTTVTPGSDQLPVYHQGLCRDGERGSLAAPWVPSLWVEEKLEPA